MFEKAETLAEWVAGLEEELQDERYEEAKASLDFIISVAQMLKDEL